MQSDEQTKGPYRDRKMKSLLLENYRVMYKRMHDNTREKARIKNLIEELENEKI